MEMINKKLGLATAGVLMGMSMGMAINQHIHADTTVPTPVHATIDTSDAALPDRVVQTSNPDKGNTSLNMDDENAPAPGPEDYSNEGAASSDSDGATDDRTSTVTESHADSAVTGSKKTDDSTNSNAAITANDNTIEDAAHVDDNQGEGLRIHSILPDGTPSAWQTRGNVQPTIKLLQEIPVGQKYDLTPYTESAWPDYDIMGWRNKDGSPAKMKGVVPKGGLDLYWVVQPTGNTISEDKAGKEADAWIKKNGIPKDRKNQAYDGKTEKQFWDDFNKAQHEGNSGSGSTISENSGPKVAQDHKLTFNVLFNGKNFGSETVTGHAGDHYYLQKIGELQKKLEEKGLTLTPASKKLISGEIPDHDMTYNLKVVKTSNVANNSNNTSNNDSAPVDHHNGSTTNNNGSKNISSSNDDQDVSDAVNDSFGPSHHVGATVTGNGATDEESVDDNSDNGSAGTSNADSNSDGTTGDNQSQNSQENQDNQQLPQTGSHQNQLAIIGFGLAMLGAGSIVLLKKKAE